MLADVDEKDRKSLENIENVQNIPVPGDFSANMKPGNHLKTPAHHQLRTFKIIIMQLVMGSNNNQCIDKYFAFPSMFVLTMSILERRKVL